VVSKEELLVVRGMNRKHGLSIWSLVVEIGRVQGLKENFACDFVLYILIELNGNFPKHNDWEKN
jgi:hypothetical protein